MTRNQQIENLAAAGLFVTVAAAVWRPEMQWVVWLGGAAFLLAIIVSLATSVPADREPRRRGGWVIPLAVLVLAIQQVSIASPDTRARAMIVAGGLVVAGVVLLWAWRHTA